MAIAACVPTGTSLSKISILATPPPYPDVTPGDVELTTQLPPAESAGMALLISDCIPILAFITLLYSNQKSSTYLRASYGISNRIRCSLIFNISTHIRGFIDSVLPLCVQPQVNRDDTAFGFVNLCAVYNHVVEADDCAIAEYKGRGVRGATCSAGRGRLQNCIGFWRRACKDRFGDILDCGWRRRESDRERGKECEWEVVHFALYSVSTGYQVALLYMLSVC